MATLQPFPKFRAFDANGNPLTGGKVYTYAAGTSTPLVTYTDSSGDPSAENQNPVTLDANGQADIWYGANLYKLVLFDADGVLQWTVDNIGSESSTSTTNGGFGTATDVPSASLVDLGTIASHFANITGTTTITSFGTSALTTAPIYLIKFESALTLTDSANMFLPGATNILTAQNDRALVEYLGSGAWRVFSYMRADGTPVVVVPISSGGTGQITALLGFDALKQASTTSYTGVVELATDAEAQAKTDTVRALTPSNLAALTFTSAAQTVTAAGTLTIAHGLGVTPSRLSIKLICLTGEYGYNTGDVVFINPGMDANTGSFGCTVTATSTNLNIQYGGSATTFIITRRTAPIGQQVGITNANWQAIFVVSLV